MSFLSVIITTCILAGIIGFVITFLINKVSDDNSTVSSLGLIFSAIFLVVGLITFSCLKPWAFVDNYELGYMYDSTDGSITVLPHTGYVKRTPFFQNIHTIDLRPRQVCITVGSSTTAGVNNRVLNCKLVSFNPHGLMLFLQWHGRGDYSDDTLNDLLKIYAYDPSHRVYPFLNVSDTTQAVTPQVIGQPVSAAQ